MIKLSTQPIKDERGIATLLVVIVTSILMSVITIAMVATMAGELRQASDNENSVKAYYAAQTGVEEAEMAILTTPSGSLGSLDQNCTFNNPSGVLGQSSSYSYVNGSVELTCLKLQTAALVVNDSAAVDAANQYDLTAISSVSRLDLAWSNTSGNPIAPFADPKVPGAASPTLPWSAPPVMEVTAVYYHFDGTNIYPADTGLKTMVLGPCYANTGMSCGPAKVTMGVGTASKATCNPSPTLGCHVSIILNPPPGQYFTIFRVRPRFAAANYSLQAFASGNVSLKIPLSSATIDATAQAGDSTRRISETYKIRSQPLDKLNEVIFGLNDICKDWEIVGTTLKPRTCPDS